MNEIFDLIGSIFFGNNDPPPHVVYVSMTITRIAIWMIFCCGIAGHLGAQDFGATNLRFKSLSPDTGLQALDSLLVFPLSVKIWNAAGDTLLTKKGFHIAGRNIRFENTDSLPGKVLVSYRVFNPAWSQLRRLLDTTLLKPGTDLALGGVEYRPPESIGTLKEMRGLDYSGSFSRGFTLGNNQDLALNSNFNLQLSGRLGDDIEVVAAITDENLPLQPEGNTQTLREFDKIFIGLKRKNAQLIAGDYELKRPKGYFLNYLKKLQGATYSTESPLGKGTLQAQGSVALTRGKFARNTLPVQEGNQGPYRLSGNEGERFIIVLSGTEKVWIDGAQLNRGLESDYVIDYNRGEVTFTPTRLITKDSRVVVEFEYADQNYSRSIYAVNTAYQVKNWNAYFNLYNEQDSKTPAGNLSLSQAEKQALAEAGDDPSKAIVSSIEPLESGAPFRVSYQLKDTVDACGQTRQILVYAPNTGGTLYAAVFSFVGAGNGQYRLDNNALANDRVFRWVAPDSSNCMPMGEYEPVQQLPAPKSQRLMTMGLNHKLGDKGHIQAEMAWSQKDLNRFSSLDSRDDNGIGFFASGNRKFNLSKAQVKNKWSVDLAAGYEWIQANFNPLNPYRSPEFTRDWGLTGANGQLLVTQRVPEHLGRAEWSLIKQGIGTISYNYSAYSRDTAYRAAKHGLKFHLDWKGWQASGDGSLLNSDGNIGRTYFLRPKATLSKTFAKWKNLQIGYYGELEKNLKRTAGQTALLPASFGFDVYKLFINLPATEKLSLEAFYSKRLDYLPLLETFRNNSTADVWNVKGSWKPVKNVQWNNTMAFRRLAVADSIRSGKPANGVLLSRSELQFNFFKGAMRSTTVYELGSGQEPRQEFTFIKVAQGQGTHVWLDSLYNKDGVIQVFEMEPAPFQDRADYVKVFTVSSSYIRTNNAGVNQSLFLDPRAVWFNATGIKRFTSRFSFQSILTVTRKTLDQPGVDSWNPLQWSLADSSLVSLTAHNRNVLFFNRSDPNYDIQLGNSNNRNKIAQTLGSETRDNEEWFVRLRWNLSSALSANVAYTAGARKSTSTLFSGKDYNIRFGKVEPQLNYQPSRTFRSSLRLRYQVDDNSLEANAARAKQYDSGVEAVYSKAAQSSIRFQLSYIGVDFDGNAQSPVGFAILNGLQKGNNWLWNLGFERQLGKGIQLNISYEGRKTGAARVAHTGRAQVTALF